MSHLPDCVVSHDVPGQITLVNGLDRLGGLMADFTPGHWVELRGRPVLSGLLSRVHRLEGMSLISPPGLTRGTDGIMSTEHLRVCDSKALR